MKQQETSGSEHPFDPLSYGETEPYSPEQSKREPAFDFAPPPVRAEQFAPPPKRGGRLPYIAVSLFAALLAVLQLIMPFVEWVAFRYQALGHTIAGGKRNLIELGKKFLFSDNIVTFLTGLGDNLDVSEYLPPSAREKFAQGRAAGIVVMAIFAVSLLLFLSFAVLSLARRRAATAVGVTASVLNIAGCCATFYAMNLINSILEQYDVFSWRNMQFSLCSAPTLCVVLSVAIIVFAVLAAVFRRFAYRHY